MILRLNKHREIKVFLFKAENPVWNLALKHCVWYWSHTCVKCYKYLFSFGEHVELSCVESVNLDVQNLLNTCYRFNFFTGL